MPERIMATTFKDKKGREWDLALDLRIARIVDKSDFTEYWDRKFSILTLDPDLIKKLLTDGPFLFAIIWAMVQEQLPATFPPESEAAEAEFVSGVNGPTIEAARTAMIEALGDFFPEQRTALFILRDQVKILGEKASQRLQEAVPLLNEMLDEEMDQRVATLREEFRKTLAQRNGETSTPSPAISDSAQETSGSPA